MNSNGRNSGFLNPAGQLNSVVGRLQQPNLHVIGIFKFLFNVVKICKGFGSNSLHMKCSLPTCKPIALMWMMAGLTIATIVVRTSISRSHTKRCLDWITRFSQDSGYVWHPPVSNFSSTGTTMKLSMENKLRKHDCYYIFTKYNQCVLFNFDRLQSELPNPKTTHPHEKDKLLELHKLKFYPTLSW